MQLSMHRGSGDSHLRHTSEESGGRNRLLHLFLSSTDPQQNSSSKPLYLRSGRMIYEYDEPITYLYFPVTATVSLQSLLDDGQGIEVGVVGKEGVVGLSALLGSQRSANRAVAQSPGKCLRVSKEIIQREFDRGGQFHRQTLLYTSTLMNVIAQTAACGRRHSVKQRFSRWLLMVGDRTGANDLPLTQDFIAQLLGSRRASITAVANELENEAAISHTRGNIRILNRASLERAACECYQINREEFDRFLKSYANDYEFSA